MMDDLLVAVSCEDRTLREQWLDVLRTSDRRNRWQRCATRVEVRDSSSLQEMATELDDYFRQQRAAPAILISDQLARRALSSLHEDWEPTEGAKELRDHHVRDPFAMVALVNSGTRVPEIDFSVPAQCRQADALMTLELATDKLSYLLTPRRRLLANPVTIRELRLKRELRDYFRLRYRVYSSMGYVAKPLLHAPSNLELEWSDKAAFHVGAFETRPSGRERLIGCARLVTSHRAGSEVNRYVSDFFEEDAELEDAVETSHAGFELPLINSYRSGRGTSGGELPAEDELRSLRRRIAAEELHCGELSRVIVHQDFRGAGIANLLVRFALFQAAEIGLDAVLLECLERHVPFYEKFGFQPVAGRGAKNRVVGVGHTMYAMKLLPIPSREVFAGAELFLQRRQLCACAHDCNCHRSFYELSGTPACPLRKAW